MRWPSRRRQQRSVLTAAAAEDSPRSGPVQGWEKGGEWADFSFQEQNDAKIECMALVGDKRWKELVLAFVGHGLRAFPIEYFEHGEVAKARAWLKSH